MIKTSDIETFILAGGKSSRMGDDKGMLRVNGKHLIEFTIEPLKKSGLNPKIIANNESYKIFGLEVFPDEVKGKGPIGGLLTSMVNCKRDHLLLISCDMPFISEDSVAYLLAESEDGKICVSSDGEKINPLFAIYPVTILGFVNSRINENKLKMTELILSSDHRVINMSAMLKNNPYLFLNINTRSDFENLRHSLNK
ncbi:MAG: molybdenum cofactor guanylyltransferase [Ignavibacteriaceae bacterium]|nr:MAG: molybdenum cofactor guanylyltransferase [Chlorobiota bacterium]MBW7855215.1 molybdenum cofactor guanylyltransferase [Ignavibacteria bacterium]MCC6886026.1 molybdenum cofactor guanylyltransferase [Ignavibacteriales bacterium]MDL1886834.1 molybdenum cofactor guanylyltransferase [Ignavibacteria bacterium CHB1]MEB2330256.1 molybdenum cofactor guanylyltransferase [Ignavibacteriaceae bacterium]OQY77865.1 MAG: hypothetical protein B6D43_04965 [Ignavibacteriales bacterium UTCHB1]RIK50358.1 MA